MKQQNYTEQKIILDDLYSAVAHPKHKKSPEDLLTS